MLLKILSYFLSISIKNMRSISISFIRFTPIIIMFPMKIILVLHFALSKAMKILLNNIIPSSINCNLKYIVEIEIGAEVFV